MIDKFRGVSANSSPEKCAEHISEERSTEQPSGSISNGRADLRIDTGKRRSNEIDPRHSTAQQSSGRGSVRDGNRREYRIGSFRIESCAQFPAFVLTHPPFNPRIARDSRELQHIIRMAIAWRITSHRTSGALQSAVNYTPVLRSAVLYCTCTAVLYCTYGTLECESRPEMEAGSSLKRESN